MFFDSNRLFAFFHSAFHLVFEGWPTSDLLFISKLLTQFERILPWAKEILQFIVIMHVFLLVFQVQNSNENLVDEDLRWSRFRHKLIFNGLSNDCKRIYDQHRWIILRTKKTITNNTRIRKKPKALLTPYNLSWKKFCIMK